MTEQLQNWTMLKVVFEESPKHLFNQNCTPGNNPEESELDVSGLTLEQNASRALLARCLRPRL